MCRLVCVRGRTPFAVGDHLRALRDISRASREYQGHGWGCAWLDDGNWRTHHDVRPIWECGLDGFGETTLLLGHARSAFRDEGIRVENNMPFADGRHVFVFNGELHGVRIREEGRIGAEKVFRYLMRFHRGDLREAVRRGVGVIERRTRRVRAMNLAVAAPDRVVFACLYDEDPDYFQLRRRSSGDMDIVCSMPYPGETGWDRVENGAVEVLGEDSREETAR